MAAPAASTSDVKRSATRRRREPKGGFCIHSQPHKLNFHLYSRPTLRMDMASVRYVYVNALRSVIREQF